MELKEKLSILGAQTLIHSIDLISSKANFINQNDKRQVMQKKLKRKRPK